VGVTLRRPLGIIFGERGSGGVVFVEELVTDGNAARDGTVQVGDVLVRCSATVLKSGKDVVSAAEGYGDRPYDNWEQLMFDCVSPPPDRLGVPCPRPPPAGRSREPRPRPARARPPVGGDRDRPPDPRPPRPDTRTQRGEDFNTVMSAIGSNNPRWGINDVTLEFQRGPGATE